MKTVLKICSNLLFKDMFESINDYRKKVFLKF